MSEQGPVDHFTIIPRRFTDAHLADEIDSIHLVIGLHIAARCYEVRNTSDGIAPMRLTALAELCEVSEETVRRRLHELRDQEWIDFEAPAPGQRSAWRIWLVGLAQEGADTSRAPQTNHRPTTETPPSVWSLSSTDSSPETGANPHDKPDGTSSRAPHRDSERQDKRNETKRNEYERKAGIEEKLDTAVGETTAAEGDPFDAIKRARLFDEMFPPRARRAS